MICLWSVDIRVRTRNCVSISPFFENPINWSPFQNPFNWSLSESQKTTTTKWNTKLIEGDLLISKREQGTVFRLVPFLRTHSTSPLFENPFNWSHFKNPFNWSLYLESIKLVAFWKLPFKKPLFKSQKTTTTKWNTELIGGDLLILECEQGTVFQSGANQFGLQPSWPDL